MEGLFIDDDLELSKTAQSLRHSRQTITVRKVFLGQGGSYEHETLEYYNMYFRDTGTSRKNSYFLITWVIR